MSIVNESTFDGRHRNLNIHNFRLMYVVVQSFSQELDIVFFGFYDFSQDDHSQAKFFIIYKYLDDWHLQ